VTFRRGRLNILETRLKIEMETPTAPCSTGPGGAKHLKLDHRSHQNCLRFSKTMNITKRRENQELSKDQQLLNFQHQWKGLKHTPHVAVGVLCMAQAPYAT
jgi:hypothetical protein